MRGTYLQCQCFQVSQLKGMVKVFWLSFAG